MSFTKPTGLTPEYAAQFEDRAIVQAYRHREPYAPETFTILKKLIRSSSPKILDLGCGTGDLTLGLSEITLSEVATTVDAIDASTEMLTEAKARSFSHKNIHWIEARVESAPVAGPYDLITSAQSFHWMDWDLVAERLRKWLKPEAYFAIVARQYVDKHWWNSDLQAIIDKYSTNREFQKYELIEEVRKTGLFSIVGDEWTSPVSFQQPVSELVESFHSRNGFSRDRMAKAAAAAFDYEAAEHLKKFSTAGVLQLSAVSRVTWVTVNT